MKIKVSKAERTFDIFNVLFMLFMIVICIYPFIYVFFGSLSDASELMKVKGVLLKPAGFSLEGYKEVIENKDIYTGFANSIFYIVISTTLSICVSSLAAFTLSRPYLFIKRLG